MAMEVEPQSSTDLVVEAQKDMQQQKLKTASLLPSNLYITQSDCTEPYLLEDQVRLQNSSLAVFFITKLSSFKSCLNNTEGVMLSNTSNTWASARK
jgi:hypothetical protein